MSSTVLYSNFTSGLVTPKVAGQYNSTAYHNGCSVLQNFSIMLQGGLTRRPGTGAVADAVGSRIIPFYYSTDLCFMFELYGNKVRIWRTDTTAESGISIVDTKDFPFTAAQIPDIRYTQTYDTLVLVHPEVRPYLVKYDGTSFSMAYISPTLTMAADPATGLETTVADEEDAGLFTTKDFPSEAFYYAGRLWFAASKEHPFRLWASRAFDIESFEFKDREEIVDEISTTDNIISSIESGSTSLEADKVTSYEFVVREDSALKLEVGASRNDSILWMGAMGSYIIVGTSSGEWIMSGSINGLTQSISQVSSYGSSSVKPVNANNDMIFVQTGGKRMRAYIGSSDGYSSPDLAYSCDKLLSRGIVAMAWRRIPEPTLYCVLSDGALAVLYYDRLYSLSGWSEWTFTGQVKDVCVLDTPSGQTTYIVISRGDTTYLEYFREVDALDSMSYVYADRVGDTQVPYTSTMTTNPYERTTSTDGSSLGKRKRLYSVVLRIMETKAFEAGYEEGYHKSYSGDVNQDDIEILTPGGFSRRVCMTVKSIGTGSLNLLGMGIVTEVN